VSEGGEGLKGKEGRVDGGELGRRTDPEEVDVGLETAGRLVSLLGFFPPREERDRGDTYFSAD